MQKKLKRKETNEKCLRCKQECKQLRGVAVVICPSFAQRSK